MGLIIVYVVLVLVGQTLSIGVGIAVDNFSKAAGLAAFLAMYFGMFVVCWKIAVRLTDPGGPLHARFGR